MGEIMFLAHRIPFPPDRGDKIRSHHVLKGLARLAPVHVASFADDEQDYRFESDLAALAKSYRLVDRRKPLPLAGIEALASARPLSLTAFHDRRLQRYVREVLSRHPVDVIYVFSGQMAQYVPAGFRGRVVADLVDVDSAKFAAYAAKSTGFRAWMERREGRLMRAVEARIVGSSDVTLLISEAEVRLLRSRLSDTAASASKICAMGNGIDSAGFDPVRVSPEPRMLEKRAPRLIFTGQMDYAPNVEAVTRAMDRIMPLVRKFCPDATLHVVGRNPPPSLQARSGRDGIEVWGRVEDIRPWLSAADIALVPLELARGVQNKVLEAMAMQLPVVLSPEAATGIDACDGRDFLVAGSDADLADAVISLVRDPKREKRVASAARDWIVAHAGWDTALAKLPDYLGFGGRSLSDAA
ncbi:TIGR03087 family PEP-CTERM/XrtA system glycosyltransferase [Novosphingobium malaysiense]|uniref:Glycosyl transferase family 1 n=1 Tax=Novosphingobium malaysiense TaxID=1348853 RepID=A0A0B1ZPG1_9SPHN|nr:TIGR03087 family PEP-CTERM/XrtA system glycosyltransferase [Novosphingobium malaysiense]KHK91159.1 glycosyl transferase family 1 [Novosphingobium malaysiense]